MGVVRGVRGIIHTTHYTSDGNFQNLPTFTTEGAFNKVPWELGASGVDERARAHARLGWSIRCPDECVSAAWRDGRAGGRARGMYYASKKGQAQTQRRAKG